MEMTDLRALALAVHQFCQVVPPTDRTVQEMVITSMMMAEATIGDSPFRKERLDEFNRIMLEGD